MLMHILLLVVAQAFIPSPDRVASSYEARLHAGANEAPLIGAAGHIARYTPLAARAL